MVRTLFAVARASQPSVIFLDEIDSLLTARSDGEMDSTRRMKTEFLLQFDGCQTSEQDRVLFIGYAVCYCLILISATNKANELDDAALRRFRKKLYIPLPTADARKSLIMGLLKKQGDEGFDLSASEISDVVKRTEGYSGSDLANLLGEASMGPLRDIKV